MIKAASALPLMIIVQLLHSFFVIDLPFGSSVIFLDRALLASGLALYAVWLSWDGRLPEWTTQALGFAGAAGIAAIFIEARPVAIPMIWTLQAAILLALGVWLATVWRDMWQRVHLMGATLFHGLGALMLYPVCQIGRGGLYIPPENFRLACDAVTGTFISWGIFAVAGLWWAASVGAQALLERR